MKAATWKRRTSVLAAAIAVTLCAGATPVVGRSGELAAGAGALSDSGSAAASDVEQRFRYTVVLKDSPLAGYRGESVQLGRRSQSVGEVPRNARGGPDVNSAEAVTYVQLLERKQNEFLASAGAELRRTVPAQMQFQHALNAVVVELTPAEADRLRQRDDVVLVEQERFEAPNTDRSPSFIGADTIWSGAATGGVASKGEGVVIASIDSGIAWDSPSFAAVGPLDGYVHVNPLGDGNYLGTCKAGRADAGRCNSKLIGLYNYVTEVTSAADDEGHGSHTASTAAGNRRNASLLGGDYVISGMAPHANVIGYKVCRAGTADTCSNIDSLSAVNQAVTDGIVDVINYSISGGSSPWSDTVSMAFLGAVNAGIFVAASAGNNGPDASTVGHIEPWATTVAASTMDRRFGFAFSLTGPGVPPANTQNLMIAPAAAPLPTADLVDVPIIRSPNFDDGSNDGCAAYPAGTFVRGGVGAIAVLHLDGGASNCGSGVRKANALAAGAVGTLFVDQTYLNLGASGNAWAMVRSDWDHVYTHIQTDPAAATASIPATGRTFPDTPDLVADFSSRGPNTTLGRQLIVKPDLAAPGVNILAAYASKTSASASNPNLPQDANRVSTANGTSMAAPHVAGSGLLLKSLHPTWTATQIRSALMLTSRYENVRDHDLSPAGAFERGAGRIDLEAAAKTGLVMDESYANFVAANPATGGKVSSLNIPSLAEGECVATCSLTRNVQSARAHGSAPVTWTLAISGLPAGSATVSPTTITLNAAPAGASFTVKVDSFQLPTDAIAEGMLTLTPSDAAIPTAHMPIAVRRAPPAVTVSTAALSAMQNPGTTTSQSFTIKNTANPTLQWALFAADQPKHVLPLDIAPFSSGYRVGYYTGVTIGPGFYDAENFDLADETRFDRIAINGFTKPSNAITTTMVPEMTFSLYADDNGVPAGAPGFTSGALATAPLWTYKAPLDGPGVSYTKAGNFTLDLSVAGVPPLTLPAGRYWLVPFPRINSTGVQTAANPIWAWSYNNSAPQVGNRPVGIRSNDTAWETVGTANVNHLSATLAGRAPCRMPAWARYAPTPTSGALGYGGEAQVTVTFDSTGLAPGTYTGEACFTSSDPLKPEFSVGLNLVVSSGIALDQAVATPSAINSPGSTLLSVEVTPGSNPASTGIEVRADLGAIGGSASQPLFDDGTNGDATAGDGTYSYAAGIPAGVSGGSKSLPVTVTDDQQRTASATIAMEVAQQTALAATASASPASVAPGGTTHLSVSVVAGTNPPSSDLRVVADLTGIGGAASQVFADEGDGRFGYDASIAATATDGVELIPIQVSDAQGRSYALVVALSVAQPGSPSGSGLSVPGTALPGADVLLIVTAVPGSNPVSTELAVSADLGAIGGPAEQPFYDDGSHGDQTAGDGVFSYRATISASTPAGTTFQLPATLVDAQQRRGHAVIPLATGSDRLFADGFDGS